MVVIMNKGNYCDVVELRIESLVVNCGGQQTVGAITLVKIDFFLKQGNVLHCVSGHNRGP
jgi:hypothetical protein